MNINILHQDIATAPMEMADAAHVIYTQSFKNDEASLTL